METPSVSETQDLKEKNSSSSSETSNSLSTPVCPVTLPGAAGDGDSLRRHAEMAHPIDTVSSTGQTTQPVATAVPATTSTEAPVPASSQPAPETAPKLSTRPVVTGAKPSAPGLSWSGQPLQVRPPMTRVATVAQAPGKALIIAVPRATAPLATPAAPRPPLATSVQLPANFQIPPGMVLVRSDSGQLMLVSQQALAQAQQNTRASSIPALRPPTPQVPATAPIRKAESPSVIRVPPPLGPHVTSTGQKTPVIKVMGVAPTPSIVQTSQPVVGPVPQANPVTTTITKTNAPKATPTNITQATLENVKKCKNFLVTLIKLTSSGTHSPDMAKNVRELVRSLLDGGIEPEEFTNRLYRELKSSPQPYLVPFLKKSLPAVRQLTPNPQLFIQQVDLPKPQAPPPPVPYKAPIATAARLPTLLSANIMPSALRMSQPGQLVIQHPRGGAIKQAVTSSAPSHPFLSVQNRAAPRPVVIQAGQRHAGAFVRRPPLQAPPPSNQTHLSGGSYREDDDINDVAFMAGVNLSEENARILASNSAMVGSVIRSCRDEPFLPPAPLLARILHIGKALGVSEAGPDVVNLVSHATQERLRDMLGKVTVVAQHRKMALKEEVRHTQVSDVRSQLRFLEQLERLEKQRKDEEEREALLRIAKSRSNAEDPDQQLLKQRAKEMQQLEQAQQQHREANLTALAAIGPRRKTLLVSTGSQAEGAGSSVSVLQRTALQRVTRVSLMDLQFCMEQDPALRHSLLLYKALLR